MNIDEYKQRLEDLDSATAVIYSVLDALLKGDTEVAMRSLSVLDDHWEIYK